MDRKTLIAVAACVLLLILYPQIIRIAGLGRYLERSKPTPTTGVDTTRAGIAGTPTAADTTARATGGAGGIGGVPPGGAPGAPSGAAPSSATVSALRFHPTQPVMERSIRIETPLYHAEFSNRGARLISFELTRYASAFGASRLEHHKLKLRRGEEVPSGDRVVLAGSPLFGLDLGSGAALRSLADVVYAVDESTDAAGATRALTFTARDSAGLYVRQTLRVRPDNYALDLEVELRGVPPEWKLTDYALTLRSWPLLTEANLQADERALRATSLVGTNIHHENAHGLLRGPRTFEGNAAWAAVQNRYFVGGAAITQGAPRSVISSGELRPLSPEQLQILPAGTRPEQEVAVNSLVVSLPGETNPTHHFLLYFGPVEYFRLAALGVKLERAVDLGWTWVLPFSKVLLQLMNWLYGLARNYGVAIFLLATLVRVLLHPLNMASMKSQRAMQKLQPEVARIKQKYKNDAQAQNAAVMALYKENKVNPAGGCLPMLVQMPLFIALYQVLYNAIELRQAPFFGWMNDLSAPDVLAYAGPFPIRLLPLLMGGTGFLSQILMPSDPSQKPMMYMMNAIMPVFFYNLPSGLVLYWTIMNLLTAAQQWLVMRQDGAPAEPVVEVVSPAATARKRPGGRR